ncbi:tail fiber assembly protein [Pseudomonas sp. CVAP|uniref:tail fiber assembly protein n=1 Tax=Pseudomonas sp. CVAP\|nr:tail fiber assembly protein [Pseudomonas sp. CVAP\
MSIDWSRLITKPMKDAALAAERLTAATREIARRRSAADYAIAPLQDAVDIDEATDTDMALLKAWKKYRVALNRLPEQADYPTTIDWPVVPNE